MRHVLSGGLLQRPCVVQTRMVSDLVFIELSVRDSAITRFLTGQRYQKGPLRDVKVWDSLMHLRNEATDRKLKETHGGEEGEVEDLGLDGPKAKAPRRSLQSISPTIVEVDYEGTELKLLGELGTRRVWMELTPGNMKLLFDQVSAEWGSGGLSGGLGRVPSEGKRYRQRCLGRLRGRGLNHATSISQKIQGHHMGRESQYLDCPLQGCGREASLKTLSSKCACRRRLRE